MSYELHLTRADAYFEDENPITIADIKKIEYELPIDFQIKSAHPITTIDAEDNMYLHYHDRKGGYHDIFIHFMDGHCPFFTLQEDQDIVPIFDLADMLKAKIQGDDLEYYTREAYETNDYLIFDNFNFKLAIIQVLMYELNILPEQYHEGDNFMNTYDDHGEVSEEVAIARLLPYIEKAKQYFQNLKIEKKYAGLVKEIHVGNDIQVYFQVNPQYLDYDDYFDEYEEFGVKDISDRELKQFYNLEVCNLMEYNLGGNALQEKINAHVKWVDAHQHFVGDVQSNFNRDNHNIQELNMQKPVDEAMTLPQKKKHRKGLIGSFVFIISLMIPIVGRSIINIQKNSSGGVNEMPPIVEIQPDLRDIDLLYAQVKANEEYFGGGHVMRFNKETMDIWEREGDQKEILFGIYTMQSTDSPLFLFHSESGTYYYNASTHELSVPCFDAEVIRIIGEGIAEEKGILFKVNETDETWKVISVKHSFQDIDYDVNGTTIFRLEGETLKQGE